ncbi:uncharacterized protein LOC129003030 isoform X2 [Macrosteles quadrilineatus]|nr:uncharacterized protein LOC129003030 isoform X2 [Macrosteles quadrilineatus]
MERYNINRMALPHSGQDSYIAVQNSIFPEFKDHEITGDEENFILKTRTRFEAAVKKFKAPNTLPIIFRNSCKRGSYLDVEIRRLKLSAKNPPDEPLVTFTFAEDIFAELLIKFSEDYPKGKYKPYLLLDKPTNFVTLRKEFCPEDAFEEVFTSNPLYYSADKETLKKSRYVEPDEEKWKTHEGCLAMYSRVDDNEVQFIVDFSVIYPENIWSTAMVICWDCGKAAEIDLCHAVREAARKEIYQNIAMCNIQRRAAERERCVIHLPITNSLQTHCSFREGLMGFTPLTQSGSDKPSLFVRTRITFYTTELSRLGEVLHSHE